jgi:TolB-like protein/Flp pilus assembly protein TadD
VPAKSIAVLPFENLSADKGNAYFADGIQDEILTALAKIGDLKVISRTSTQRYASEPDNLPEIARQLGVAKILEGSVQKAGDRVRINVQLIDAASDNHLWAETYDRNLDDVFGVESEVAEKIATSLQAVITGDERRALGTRPTANPDAYAAYLKARALLTRRSSFDRSVVEQIIAAYQQAVALDPDFALAWAGLVRQHVWMYWEGFDANPTRLAMATAALDRATALAPQAPQVQVARGWYEYYGRHDFAAALAAFRGAQRGLPNDADVWYGSGFVARRLGHYDEAVRDLQHARELDPNDVDIAMGVAEVLLGWRHFDAADAAVDAGLALDPGNPMLRRIKLELFWRDRDLSAAGRMLGAWHSDSALGLANRATQAMYQRDYAAASGLFARAIATSPDATIYTSYGEYIPAAFDWRLQRALCEARLGHAATASALYREVQGEARALLARKPGNVHVEVALHSALGEALAGLGMAKEAVDEGRRAVALIPESRDAWEGQIWQQDLARILSINGDADEATPLIAHLLETPGYHPLTTARLHLDPVWDPIRNDPRFQALLKQYDSARPAAASSGAAP